MSLDTKFAQNECLVCEGKHWQVTDVEHCSLIDAVIGASDARKRFEITTVLQDICQREKCEKAARRVEQAADKAVFETYRVQFELSFRHQLESKDQQMEGLRRQLADRNESKDRQMEKLRRQFADRDLQLADHHNGVQEVQNQLKDEVADLKTQLGDRDQIIQELQQKADEMEARYAESHYNHGMTMRAKRKLAEELEETSEKFKTMEKERVEVEAGKKWMFERWGELSNLRAEKRARTQPPVHKLRCFNCFKTMQGDCDGTPGCQNCLKANLPCTYRLCRPYDEKARFSHGKGCTKVGCTQFHDEKRDGYCIVE
ncbi:uncharacterized protein BDZ99DRAFT_562283 [Mytilinidion resinicola]|uniref:Uncharacterized protein n=1 Tax=Mytilinidion resinicola TaxID=574789 RepID=A0A6A6YT55_9PEZI|nr:uncharacterized protein BDZ99DRAFT_562283 [Mytilinidion resinicola]KAF2811214.1 hypothetical protein BDZ99DRAFT_562283 [Mytilinidion resinicola]